MALRTVSAAIVLAAVGLSSPAFASGPGGRGVVVQASGGGRGAGTRAGSSGRNSVDRGPSRARYDGRGARGVQSSSPPTAGAWVGTGGWADDSDDAVESPPEPVPDQATILWRDTGNSCFGCHWGAPDARATTSTPGANHH